MKAAGYVHGKRTIAISENDGCKLTREGVDFTRAARWLLRIFSSSNSTQKFLDKVVRLIQRESGCKYVGIRVLDETGHIPYQAYVGFSREFWEEENMIQVSREDCGCTRIVSGNLLPCDKTVINKAGSLWINDSVAFVEKLSAAEVAAYRGACVRSGYRSIAIVPIFYGKVIKGLIHLADPQPAQISRNVMEFVETIAPLVGEVLNKDKVERNLKAVEQQRNMLESIIGGIGNLAFVVNLDTYELIYFQKDWEQFFGPDIIGRKCHELFGFAAPCPDCPPKAADWAGGPCAWERHDPRHDHHYLAEKKDINWLDGEVIHAAFVTDITNQRKTEQALKDSIITLQELSASLEEEIMERQAAQENLGERTEEFRRKALTDPLTGLPNRACLNERLEEEMEKAHGGELAGALLFLDLDDLKMVNDTFGHKRGDALIIMAGALVVAETGPDAFIARVGGDEFIIVLPGKASRLELADVADRIIRSLKYEYDVLGTRLQTSASIGIALYPADGDTAEEIFKNADSAMYAAKRAGKNCWRFYEATMQAEVYESVVMTSHLRSALKHGEFSVLYQPQVAAKSHSVIGFEALLRWNSPEHGAVSPGNFIPLAEKSGLIQSIGQWVLREACQFAGRLAKRGWGDIRVAVNVSPYQLASEDFVAIVRDTLNGTRIQPRQIELEITETALISSLESSFRNLGELHAIGVRLALDDFGTGYSSLTYLHRLPVHTLKIDKSFIDTILVDKVHPVMIGSIVDMAHGMGITVAAEGVETSQQLDFLAENRCDLIQGFFFSRPVAEADAIRFLREHAG